MTVPGAAPAAAASGCPSVGNYPAPREAAAAARGLDFSLSPSLTRYAMGAAATSAATATKAVMPIHSLTLSAPSPPLREAQAGAASCGYTGRLLGVKISPALRGHDHTQIAWLVREVLPLLRRGAAFGVGAAFDRYGDVHLVMVSGSTADDDQTDPYAEYTEAKPTAPLEHASGLLIQTEAHVFKPHLCDLVPMPHIHVTIYRANRSLLTRATNAKGELLVELPAGTYGYKVSGSFHGTPVTNSSIQRGYSVPRGQIVPLPIVAAFGCG
jgi:hypothetical protein